MKINKKLLIAILLIGAVSCASNNTVGVDQQQEYVEKYNQQKENSGLQNIRDEILGCNFTGIDPNMFVMTIASAKIGSLTNKLTQNKIIDDKLISAFQKAIVEAPKIKCIQSDSSKIDIKTLHDQINAIHLSVNYACIKDAVNVINSRESGELKVITDFVIALRLFDNSLVALICEDKDGKYVALREKILKLFENSLAALIDKDKDGEYAALRNKIQELDVAFSKKKVESKNNALIKMLQSQFKDTVELGEKLEELHKGDDHENVLNFFNLLKKGYNDIIESITSENSEKLLSRIEELKRNIEHIQEMSETCNIHSKKDDEESVSDVLRRYAMLCRISSAMSLHAKSLKQLENEIQYSPIIKYLI